MLPPSEKANLLGHPHLVVDMNAVNEADAMRMRLHDERRRPDAVTKEPDAFHQRAIGHAGGGKHNVVAGGEVLRAVGLLEVGDPHRPAALFVLRCAHHESSVYLAAQTA